MSASEQPFPSNWIIGQDYDPNQHLINLKGRDYLNVQNRLLWFIRDQRALVVAGLAKVPYVIQTELVELDRSQGWAHFKTFIRDVLGNESTMYGSESARDFPDFAEKASTKSVGRALLALGYGTAFAPEMDEGDRVVDSPRERSRVMQMNPERVPSPARAVDNVANDAAKLAATEKQITSIRKLCEALGRPYADDALSYGDAREMISRLSADYQRMRRAV